MARKNRHKKNSGDRKNDRKSARRQRRKDKKADRQARRVERMNIRNAARLARKGQGGWADAIKGGIETASQLIGKGQNVVDAAGAGMTAAQSAMGASSGMPLSSDGQVQQSDFSTDSLQTKSKTAGLGIFALVVVIGLFVTGAWKKIFKSN